MRSAVRRVAVVSAVAAAGAVVWVPPASAATEELPGFCRKDGFRGNASMLYEQIDGVYRPTGATAGTGPHLGDSAPLSARARLQITHLPAGATEEIVDFDKTRTRLTTGVSVSEPVDGVEIPVTARTRFTATFTFAKPGGGTAICSVVKDV